MDAQPVEHRLEVDQVVELHVAGLGLAIAAPVVADDVVALGRQLSHLLGPHAPVGDAGMEEHHRNAEAGGLAADQRTIEVDFKGGGHGQSPSKQRPHLAPPAAGGQSGPETGYFTATMNSRGKRSSTLPSTVRG